METAIARTLAVNAMTVEDFGHVELYSCFHCVPKMARRIRGWPWDRPATVFGGLTFGGGPIANYMSHAIVAMVETLRREGRLGFLFANGGFATDHHCIFLGNAPIPAPRFPQAFAYPDEAEEQRCPVARPAHPYVDPHEEET